MTYQNDAGLSSQLLEKFQENFNKNDKYKLAQNVCTQFNVTQVAANRSVKQSRMQVYNHQLKEPKPITNQKNSGRCWIYAMLNCMRIPFMAKYKLTEFEFSQNYLFFWDKVERANYMLDAFVDAARRGETYSGRLISCLLTCPANDGGQWDMLTNLVEKYGVVPKSCYPEAENGQSSGRLGRLLNNKLREYCMRLHKMVTNCAADSAINDEKESMMEEVYRIMCICLGTPPVEFEWDFTITIPNDPLMKVKTFGPMSPQEFYRQHIKPDCFNMEDMVCLVNDPRSENPYNHLYTVEYLGNMTKGRDVRYINKEIQYLKNMAARALSVDRVPVWFGCDVGQSRSQDGALDLEIMDYKQVFDVNFEGMSKAERLMYGQSLMTHAMVFTGVNLLAAKRYVDAEGEGKMKILNKDAADAQKIDVEKYLAEPEAKVDDEVDKKVDTADKGIGTSERGTGDAVDTANKGTNTSGNAVDTADKRVGDSKEMVNTAEKGVGGSHQMLNTAEKGVGGSEKTLNTAEKGVGGSEKMVSTAEKGNDTAEKGDDTVGKIDEPADKQDDTAGEVGNQQDKATEKDLTADRWKVENSWGETSGFKGYFTMTDEWFSEYVYEVVVHKKLLDAETLAILDQKPRVLPAWDPMGALARS